MTTQVVISNLGPDTIIVLKEEAGKVIEAHTMGPKTVCATYIWQGADIKIKEIKDE